MSKLGAFVGGFGAGMKLSSDLEESKRRRKMEESRERREQQRFEIEQKRLEDEQSYRDDLKAAGNVMTTGTSGVEGVRVGSQQDAQLAEQNIGVTDNRQVTPSQGLGVMRDTAMRHGRVQDATAFTTMQRQDDAYQLDQEWKNGRYSLLNNYQNGDKSLSGTMDFYRQVGLHDFKYGKANLGDLATVDDRAKKLEKEGMFDAFQYYQATGDLNGTVDRFDAVGQNKIDRKSLKVDQVKDKVTGQTYPSLSGQFKNGQPFRFDPAQMAYMMGGYEAYKSSRHEAVQDKQFQEGKALQRDQLDETKRNNKASELAAMIAAENKGKGKGDTSEYRQLVSDALTKVLQPRYGGKMEGGVWFPDEANKNVALRAQALAAELIRNGMDHIEAASRAAQQAERENATGRLPIGQPANARPGTAPAGIPTPWR